MMQHTTVDLPLFPLNSVLFPGMPISLHIFEERYKQMMAACMHNQQPFGVVALRRGREAGSGLIETYDIGVTAVITHVQPLDEGRLNVIAIGNDRFAIRALDHSLPYLRGTVEVVPHALGVPQAVDRLADRVRPWVRRYLDRLASMQQIDVDPPNLPDAPEDLAYLASFVLQIPVDDKQSLLSTRRLDKLLADLYRVYRRETTILRALIQTPTSPVIPFSLS